MNRRSANPAAQPPARRRPRVQGVGAENETAAGLVVVARRQPAARSPAYRRVELGNRSASSLTACGRQVDLAGGNAVSLKASDGKWRTRQDSNLWPLPSEN